ncbi:MAG: undecaprenyl-diphosphate phosphatase, partial [Acidimicrobiia bacterium]|nr:undecaprenyl-diphosphate phosphatase [Acidimicrobiia bacterium]
MQVGDRITSSLEGRSSTENTTGGADGGTIEGIKIVLTPPPRLLTTISFGVGLVAFAAVPALALAQTGDPTLSFTVLDAVIVGLVEGVTEYLPVSSTGHILMANELLGLNETAEAERLMDAYAICVQAGAILAVLVVYKDRIRQMVEGLLGRSVEGRRLLFAVFASFVPTAILAVTLFDFVKERLFGVGYISIAWIGGGLLILFLGRGNFFNRPGKELHELTVKNALVIGLMQALAMWPGTSRSLVTIIAGLLVGLSLRAAVEYSFLLGLLTLTAATAFAGLQDGSELVSTFGWFTPAVGLVVAFVSAVAAVRWMVSYLN